MGRRPKFKTPQQFEKLVKKYFDGIRRIEPVLEKRLVYAQNKGYPEVDDDGALAVQKDENGHDLMRWEIVRTVDGKPAKREVWLIPPSVTGICDYLGISRETWSEYARKEGFADVVESAKRRIETYLQMRMIEDGKAARGAMFSLQYNFGWKTRSEMSMDASTRAAVSAAGCAGTLEEKMALLKELGLTVPGMENTEEEVRTDDSAEVI